MTFLVHGATGAQGAPVLTALSRSGKDVVAAVRSADSYTRGPAVSIDNSSEASLVTAYTGKDGVFVHLPLGAPQQQIEQARVIVAAVDRARPAHVVFSTSGYALGTDDDSPHGLLMRGLQDTGVPTAVVAPRLFLENLLLPPVLASARDSGVLGYPVRTDYRVSWISHLDVADVVARLFDRTDITGVVEVGALPGLIGDDLAAGFTGYLGRDVRFDAQTPDEFGEAMTPLFGAEGIAPVVESYRWRATQTDDVIGTTRSAQELLGLQPLSVEQWLRQVGA